MRACYKSLMFGLGVRLRETVARRANLTSSFVMSDAQSPRVASRSIGRALLARWSNCLLSQFISAPRRVTDATTIGEQFPGGPRAAVRPYHSRVVGRRLKAGDA